jgi:hypothetical protein
LDWDYSIDLNVGMELTYKWISTQIESAVYLKEKV